MPQRFLKHAPAKVLFDILPDAALIADTSRIIRAVNAAATKLFGYDAEEMLGRTTEFLYAEPSDFTEQGRARYNTQAMSSVDNPTYEVRYKAKNGRIFWSETTGAIAELDGGVVGFMAVIKDVSQSRDLTEVLKSLYAVTSNQDLTPPDKIADIVEVGRDYFRLPLGIVSEIVGNKYTVQYCADPSGALSARTEFDVAGTYCFHTLVADAPTAFHEAGKSEIAQHPCYKAFGLEAYIGAPIYVDGVRYGTLNYSSSEPRSPFTSTEHAIIQLIADWAGQELARIKHIAELRAAISRAEENERRAAAANAAKGDFLATMSHEIRTPMNGVLGMLQVLRRTNLDTRQTRMVSTAFSSGNALLGLLNDILDFSKLDAGKMELCVAPVRLKDLFSETAALFSPLAEEKGIGLQFDLSGLTIDEALTDSLRVRQVLNNLVGNAVKFTERGWVSVSAKVLAEKEGQSLHIRVDDTGIGISRDALEVLFERFNQADATTTRRFGGTGLGLAISQEIAHLLGGSIAVESTPGAGSHFTVQIPISIIKSKELRTESIANTSPPRAAKRARVLVAEDNPVNQEVMREFLTSENCDVVIAGDGVAALEAMQTERIDIVLMDIHMPRMDGIEAVGEIRALEAPKHAVPVIAVTADASSDDAKRFKAAGFDAHLPKPIQLERLSEVLHRLIDKGDDDHDVPARVA